MFDSLAKKYELIPKDLSMGSQTIYMGALMDIAGKEKEKKDKLASKLTDLIDIEVREREVL